MLSSKGMYHLPWCTVVHILSSGICTFLLPVMVWPCTLYLFKLVCPFLVPVKSRFDYVVYTVSSGVCTFLLFVLMWLCCLYFVIWCMFHSTWCMIHSTPCSGVAMLSAHCHLGHIPYHFPSIFNYVVSTLSSRVCTFRLSVQVRRLNRLHIS